MVKIKTDNIFIYMLVFIAVVILAYIFLLWEWSLIRDVAIAFMPVYSAEALAWIGVIFGFKFISNKVDIVNEKEKEDDE